MGPTEPLRTHTWAACKQEDPKGFYLLSPLCRALQAPRAHAGKHPEGFPRCSGLGSIPEVLWVGVTGQRVWWDHTPNILLSLEKPLSPSQEQPSESNAKGKANKAVALGEAPCLRRLPGDEWGRSPHSPPQPGS